MSNDPYALVWEGVVLDVFCANCHWHGDADGAAWRGDEHATWWCPQCGAEWKTMDEE